MDEPFKRIRYDTKEFWHKLRGQCIGGSDAAAIIGENPWKTSVELYKQKKGLVEKDDISDNAAVKYGTTCEDAIRTIFGADYDGRLQVIHTNDHLSRLDKPYLGASLDGEIIVLEDTDFVSYGTTEILHLKKGMHGILEVKTTTVLNSMHKEKWGDSVPQNYFIQTLHYLNVTKWDFVILVALLRFDYGNNIFSQLRQYGYLASDRLEDMRYLEAEEDKWWNEYYLKSQEPPLRLPSL